MAIPPVKRNEGRNVAREEQVGDVFRSQDCLPCGAQALYELVMPVAITTPDLRLRATEPLARALLTVRGSPCRHDRLAKISPMTPVAAIA